MDFNDNEKEAAFRAEVRKFLDKNAKKRTNTSSSSANAAAPETLRGKEAQVKARFRLFRDSANLNAR